MTAVLDLHCSFLFFLNKTWNNVPIIGNAYTAEIRSVICINTGKKSIPVFVKTIVRRERVYWDLSEAVETPFANMQMLSRFEDEFTWFETVK